MARKQKRKTNGSPWYRKFDNVWSAAPDDERKKVPQRKVGQVQPVDSHRRRISRRGMPYRSTRCTSPTSARNMARQLPDKTSELFERQMGGHINEISIRHDHHGKSLLNVFIRVRIPPDVAIARQDE